LTNNNNNNNRKKKKQQQNKVCVECKRPESSKLRIVTVILPPTLPKKTDLCEPCLEAAIDNSILKNRAKHREEHAAY
jgi:hypothetical protein